jgi:hypothetical protein
VLLGLFALVAIVIVAASDQSVLSYSIYVLFPQDSYMRVVLGLAFTMLEIVVGHLLAETIGHSPSYLDRIFSPRKRALICLAAVGVIAVLLSCEYGLAFRRSLALAAISPDGATVLQGTVDAPAISPDAVATAHLSGFVAFGLGLAEVMIGIALVAALRAVVCIADGLLRVLAALCSPILYVIHLMMKAVAAVVNFPSDAYKTVRPGLKGMCSVFEPVALRTAMRIREPNARGLRNSADCNRAIMLYNVIRNMPDGPERRKLEAEYTALIDKAPDAPPDKGLDRAGVP